jgi:hypothetical protein
MSQAAIATSKLLVVEGKDDKNFFEALLGSMNLAGVQVTATDGSSSLADKLSAVRRLRGFAEVTSFGLVRDADLNCTDAFLSICHALRQANFAVPRQPLQSENGSPNVVVMLMPGYGLNGMLEDLCLRSVQDDPAMPCLEQFFTCVNGNGLTQQNLSKAKVHAFLATRPIPEKRLGEAALANYWPFEAQAFNEVKAFLRML